MSALPLTFDLVFSLVLYLREDLSALFPLLSGRLLLLIARCLLMQRWRWVRGTRVGDSLLSDCCLSFRWSLCLCNLEDETFSLILPLAEWQGTFKGLWLWCFPDPPLGIEDTFLLGFPGDSDSKELACNAGDPGSIPTPREGNGNPTPIFLPGKSHWQRSLVGCSSWGSQKSWTWTRDCRFCPWLCRGQLEIVTYKVCVLHSFYVSCVLTWKPLPVAVSAESASSGPGDTQFLASAAIVLLNIFINIV